MDSLTQFVLGAAVSTALLGKKIGPRKAALVGGALGTLPDLDVLIPFADPVDSFVYHRGWTHSVFVHALAAPVIGEGLLRLFRGLRDHRMLVWLTVFLCLATHAGIDAMTIYGTRLFWPFYPDPVGVGSVFIIDPLYTIPLLVVCVWALFQSGWTRTLGRAATGALVISTGYLGLSVVLQQSVEAKAARVLAERGGEPDKVLALAMPLNILVWKVIGLRENSYDNLYVSLLDDGDQPPEIYSHPRSPALRACLGGGEAYRKLDWFSHGYFRMDLIGDEAVLSDLRMGLTPGYAFRFVVGKQEVDGLAPVAPKRFADTVRVEPGDWDWLGERLLGRSAQRPAEAVLRESVPGPSGMACAAPSPTAG